MGLPRAKRAAKSGGRPRKRERAMGCSLPRYPAEDALDDAGILGSAGPSEASSLSGRRWPQFGAPLVV
jgi:hypothetical protein